MAHVDQRLCRSAAIGASLSLAIAIPVAIGARLAVIFRWHNGLQQQHSPWLLHWYHVGSGSRFGPAARIFVSHDGSSSTFRLDPTAVGMAHSSLNRRQRHRALYARRQHWSDDDDRNLELSVFILSTRGAICPMICPHEAHGPGPATRSAMAPAMAHLMANVAPHCAIINS